MCRLTSPLLAAAALLLTAGLAPAQDRADDAVIPTSARNIEGNSDNCFPFGGDPMRYQQVVVASEFNGGARTFRSIALRPDTLKGTPFNETLANIEIRLSTTLRGPATLSKTFADNIGADQTLVHSGRLALSSSVSGPSDGPSNFDVVIPLQTPFLYDPAAGNLLIDIRNLVGGKATQFDAQDAPDTTARVWSDKVNAPTAILTDTFPSIGLVLKFMSE